MDDPRQELDEAMGRWVFEAHGAADEARRCTSAAVPKDRIAIAHLLVPELVDARGGSARLAREAVSFAVRNEREPPKLAIAGNDSGGERVQKLLPGAHVVKAFNTVGNPFMFRPEFPGGPPDMFIAGNDEDAKKKVTGT